MDTAGARFEAVREALADKKNILTVKMEIVQIPLAVASDMAGAVKKFF